MGKCLRIKAIEYTLQVTKLEYKTIISKAGTTSEQLALPCMCIRPRG